VVFIWNAPFDRAQDGRGSRRSSTSEEEAAQMPERLVDMASRTTTREVASGRALMRQLGNQAFSRASGAPLREHNDVRILADARENYPAWLDAISTARRTIHFEMYIIHEDEQGRTFADALIRKASEGVRVRLLYDWMGGFRKTSRGFWNRLRASGVEVRCFNPPRFDQPLAWVNRDHRKVIVVDGTVAFVTGLCVGGMWVGDPARHQDPWRDTGIELRGPAVADVEAAFAEAWGAAGDPVPADEVVRGADEGSIAGDIAVRVVATVPSTTGLFRVDLLVAAVATRTLWLTDAYFAGGSTYVQSMCAAAKDGVDVRLLVPGTSDLPLLSPISRAGFRPLLAAGVRVFEWNGSMLHAKTAVADGRWGRVGSTNLNLASWIGNRELDVFIEDEGIARRMEAMYQADLANATEVVLDVRNRVRAPGLPQHRRHRPGPGSGNRGSSGRVVAGAARIGNTVTAAITNQRALEPVEARIAFVAGGSLLVLAMLALIFPRGLAYPIAVLAVLVGIALVRRGFSLQREHESRDERSARQK
jgi:cardiolipin synthase